eukprot:gene16629-18319_t
METPLVSDSLGHTPAKRKKSKGQRIGQTTRFYGVSFLRGKLEDDKDESSENSSFFRNGGILFDTYGFLLCTLLVFSILIVTLGLSLALAGHFTKRKTLSPSLNAKNLKNPKSTIEEVHFVLKYNRMLNTFSLAGMVLLATGMALFIVLMIIPFCSTYEVSLKKSQPEQQYSLLAARPTVDDEDSGDIMINKMIQSSDCESVVVETSPETPASHDFTVFHQQLLPEDVHNSFK